MDLVAGHARASAVYAIPQDTGPMGLFYRADLFKKYGLPCRRPGRST